jgi:hypothetical protein
LGKSLTIRLAALLAGLTLLTVAELARAQDGNPAAVDRITKLNKKAVDEFENLNFDPARKILKDALDACSRSGLEGSQIAARTHVHMGVVLFAGFKQKDEALAEFKKALEIAPEIKLDKLLATPEIQEVFDQAVEAQKGGKGDKSGGGRRGEGRGQKHPPPPPPASADAITHEPITRATQGKPIQINVTLDSSVKAKKVMLSFSADGSEDFGEREMKEASPGNWMGEIPASATAGAKVSYYIEVDGDDDQVVASKGSAVSPLVVSLRGPGGAALGPGKGQKKVVPLPKKEESEGPSWYVALGIGSGFGWTTGTGEVYSQDVVKPGGFAAAKLGQLTPEVGYFLSPDLILSLQLRFQKVSGATSFYANDATTCGTSTICAPPSLAISGFARAHFLFHFDDLHPFLSAALGGGSIRHVTSFPSMPKCGSDMKTTCVDTVDSGPIFIGGGGGLLYNLSDTFALMAESNLLLGFTNFTFNVDINVGVAVEF